MKAIGNYILIEGLQNKHKEVNGLLLTEKLDIDNRYVKAKIVSVGNLVQVLKEGDIIDIIATKKSVYGYLSVEGGFKTESFLNSVSTLVRAKIGPNNGNKIRLEDKIFINKNRNNKSNFKVDFLTKDTNTIRVLKGPQYDFFSEKSKKLFFSQLYKVSNLTDRMGMRLEGKVL